MSSKATTQKMTLTLKLDNGTTTSGMVKTISQTVGTINKDAWDNDKALAIGQLVAPCLTKSIYAIEQGIINYIQEA